MRYQSFHLEYLSSSYDGGGIVIALNISEEVKE
jgi:hypothetical protein